MWYNIYYKDIAAFISLYNPFCLLIKNLKIFKYFGLAKAD